MTVQWRTRKLRILDIDAECLPGHWIGADYVSKIMTAVAWAWIGEKKTPEVVTHYEAKPVEIARQIASVIHQADLVVGHFIRGFDLGLINGNLLRGGYPPLGDVMAHDTKLDLIKSSGRSLSQKNLASQIGVAHPKVEVTVPQWEVFNLKERGMRQHGVDRVTGDVKQNIEMYKRLKDLGWMGPPRLWSPRPKGGSGRYHG